MDLDAMHIKTQVDRLNRQEHSKEMSRPVSHLQFQNHKPSQDSTQDQKYISNRCKLEVIYGIKNKEYTR